MSDLSKALMVAIQVHADQRDKQGKPYLLHVLRVVEAVAGDAKVVAALHDVREDGGDTGYRAMLALDLSSEEAVALALLTRDKACSYESYIAAINARPSDDIAREVKLADLRDNLGRIPMDGAQPWGWPTTLKDRYEKAIATLVEANSRSLTR